MRHRDQIAGWTLFLDFDGVLNNDPFLRYQRNHARAGAERLFDPSNLAALDRLCTQLPVSKIVVTSSWRLDRKLDDLVDLLAREGCSSAALILGATPRAAEDAFGRAAGIQQFLSGSRDELWFILDDLALATHFPDRFFKTSNSEGLTTELVDEVLSTLLEAPPRSQP